MAGVSTVLPSPVAPKDRMSKTVFELGSLVAFARPASPLRATPAKPVPAVFRNPRRGLLSDRMGVRVRASLPGPKPTLLCEPYRHGRSGALARKRSGSSSRDACFQSKPGSRPQYFRDSQLRGQTWPRHCGGIHSGSCPSLLNFLLLDSTESSQIELEEIF